MLDDGYLLHGLNALSRAHSMNYFADGHRGAAMIAATCFCRETALEGGVSNIIRNLIDHHWTSTSLCAPFPDETPDETLLDRIIEHLELGIGQLRQAGHNVILPALALKALSLLPEAITPSRVDGICRLIDRFTITDGTARGVEPIGPDFGSPTDAARFVLSEFLTVSGAFAGRGQGWTGHLVTHARALLDLRELGYRDTAERGEHAFGLYLRRIHRGPLATDVPRSEHPRSDLNPHERAYWERRSQGSVEIGHLFKYPYGFYGLMALTKDAGLKQQCAENAYRIF